MRPARASTSLAAVGFAAAVAWPAAAQEAAPAPASGPAPAETASRVPSSDDPMPPIKPSDATWRKGFQIGLSLGLGPGASNGYPSDARKIGRAAYYTESGTGLGSYGALWLGGALADGFSFGAGAGGGTILSGDLQSDAWNILFHADAYPLFSLGDAFRDLGIAMEAGTGFATTRNEGDDLLVEGNGAAYVSAAVFWEGLSVWRLRSGPFVGVHYLFSETMRRPLALAGFRTVLTTGP
jgi:hypothetical protein